MGYNLNVEQSAIFIKHLINGKVSTDFKFLRIFVIIGKNSEES